MWKEAGGTQGHLQISGWLHSALFVNAAMIDSSTTQINSICCPDSQIDPKAYGFSSSYLIVEMEKSVFLLRGQGTAKKISICFTMMMSDITNSGVHSCPSTDCSCVLNNWRLEYFFLFLYINCDLDIGKALWNGQMKDASILQSIMSGMQKMLPLP